METNVLSNVLRKELILTGLAAANKDAVVRAIADVFYKEGYISDADKFVQAVYDREAEGVTGIGNHVAIPHGKSEVVKQNGVVVATLKNEIEWESLDDTGAKVVVLFAVGDDSEGAKEHLRMLSMFARNRGKDTVVAKLLDAQTQEDVIKAFD